MNSELKLNLYMNTKKLIIRAISRIEIVQMDSVENYAIFLEKLRLISDGEDLTAPPLGYRTTYVFHKNKVVTTFNEIKKNSTDLNLDCNRFKSLRRELAGTETLPILSNLDSLIQTAETYDFSFHLYKGIEAMNQVLLCRENIITGLAFNYAQKSA